MYIQLPEHITYKQNAYDHAEIRNGVLHIYGKVSFRKLMYSITYMLKGNKKCYYCGKNVPKKTITLDHIIPQDLGGPTIPENLIPCCAKCNSLKSNMNLQQFMLYRSMEKNEKSQYRKTLVETQELTKVSGLLQIPVGWTQIKNVSDINIRMFDDDCRITGRARNKIKAYYEKYGYLKKIIILDKNDFIIQGYTIFMVAKELGIKQVMAIVLENVEVHS